MTILELLETHRVASLGSCGSYGVHCKCGHEASDGDEHRAHVAEVLETHTREKGAQLRQLVHDMTDPDPCWFDHHGGCQAHGYLELKPGELCPHAEAKQLLKEQP